ncbi:C-type lectin 37Da-like [Drosophila ananassae]|uniref:C-type lectin 37Da-like n=1 Tax=Drosophila ananassae TaxID=7217 RepID=UPI0013A5E9DA|nr:C-type lectin 37Da-like [Drosophila ananassae]
MFPQLVVLLGLISLSAAYSVTPFIADGIPEGRNISTDPFVKIGNGYYHIESAQPDNWFGAYESCHKINAELVAFETKEELDAVAEYISDPYLRGYWTSGNDHATKGQHMWFSNGQPILSDLWYTNEPNDFEGDERCVILLYEEPWSPPKFFWIARRWMYDEKITLYL